MTPRTTYACGASDYDGRPGTFAPGRCARSCSSCGKPGGVGPRELRPYGADGKDICAGCVFGEGDRGPDRAKLATAEKALGARLLHPGDLLLDDSEQAGPRPMTASERKRFRR